MEQPHLKVGLTVFLHYLFPLLVQWSDIRYRDFLISKFY